MKTKPLGYNDREVVLYTACGGFKSTIMVKEAYMRKNKGFAGALFCVGVLALASVSCGVSSITNLFATATPTATLTFTPTPTFTPSPTPTFTPSATATSTPLPTGVLTEPLADGTNRFTDYDNKYSLILSGDWIVIPIQKDELDAVIQKLSQENPNLVDSAKAFQDLDPKVIRMVALNGNTDYFINGYASNLNISAIDDATLSAFPLSFISGALEESFKQQGMTVLTEGLNTIENSDGVEMEYIDLEQDFGGVKIQQRMLLFKSDGKLIMITVSTIPQFKDAIFEQAKVIGISVELLK
jgi:hypothetical protein